MMNLLLADGLRRSGVQLASQGRWEDAFPVNISNKSAVDAWLRAAGPDVAIESIFCDSSGALSGFVGFRRCIEAPRERSAFWLGVLAASLESRSPKDDVKAWLALLGQPSLLDGPPDGIELGVFNQWRSAGPVTLNSDRLGRQDLETGPDWIRHGSTAPVCREYVWRTPEQFWIADVVSHVESGRHVLDVSMLPE